MCWANIVSCDSIIFILSKNQHYFLLASGAVFVKIWVNRQPGCRTGKHKFIHELFPLFWGLVDLEYKQFMFRRHLLSNVSVEQSVEMSIDPSHPLMPPSSSFLSPRAPTTAPHQTFDPQRADASTPKRRCFAHSWALCSRDVDVDEVPVPRQSAVDSPSNEICMPSAMDKEFDEYFEPPRPSDLAPRFKYKVNYMVYLRNCIRFQSFKVPTGSSSPHVVCHHEVHRESVTGVADSFDSALDTAAHVSSGCGAAAPAIGGYAAQWSMPMHKKSESG